jgi:hypothetical protein
MLARTPCRRRAVIRWQGLLPTFAKTLPLRGQRYC